MEGVMGDREDVAESENEEKNRAIITKQERREEVADSERENVAETDREEFAEVDREELLEAKSEELAEAEMDEVPEVERERGGITISEVFVEKESKA